LVQHGNIPFAWYQHSRNQFKAGTAALGSVWGRPPSAVQAEPSSAAAGAYSNSGLATANSDAASAQTQSLAERKTVITLALLGSDAGLYGAALVATLT
jgi:hypothetical protein